MLFLAFSVACAFAGNLGQMIALRAVQGFTGGVLIPMSFTLVLTKLPEAQRPAGLALFAITATFAPAIGPTIGGYLTENFGWQYIFFVNFLPGGRGAPDSAGRRQQGRLVRVTVHLPLNDHRDRLPVAVFMDRT